MLIFRLCHCLDIYHPIEEYGSSCLYRVEIRAQKRSEGKIRRLQREQHELKIPQESGWCFRRKLKQCPWNA